MGAYKNVPAAAEKEYLKNKGSKCPYCGSKNIQAASPSLGDHDVSVEVTCDDCSETWTEIFELTGILEASTPALKVAGTEFSREELDSIPASAREDEVSLCEYVSRQWKLELTLNQATKMMKAIEAGDK